VYGPCGFSSSQTLISSTKFDGRKARAGEWRSIVARYSGETTAWLVMVLALIVWAGPVRAAAQSGPDNRYCQAGDRANFGGKDGPAALPQACIYTAMAETPSGGKVISVAANGNLQTALNSAQCGDTVSLASNGK